MNFWDFLIRCKIRIHEIEIIGFGAFIICVAIAAICIKLGWSITTDNISSFISK